MSPGTGHARISWGAILKVACATRMSMVVVALGLFWLWKKVTWQCAPADCRCPPAQVSPHRGWEEWVKAGRKKWVWRRAEQDEE